jgi:predicted  nucleic acid-binding Zn-ribbon protein
MPEERTHECEKCGHVYPDGYGRLVEIPGGAEWRCHACIAPKKVK